MITSLLFDSHKVRASVAWLSILVFAVSSFAAEPDKAMNDTDITLAVRDELAFYDAVAEKDIDATTVEGIVTLEGTTTNLLSRQKAVDLAARVRGVRAIVNNIEVVPPENKDDTDIAEDIKGALLLDPAADKMEITVTVQDGVARLTGTVDSWQEKMLCIETCQSVRGVKAIQENIGIEYPAERSDTEIRFDIQRRLESDVWVDDGLIEINVSGGKVTLTGTVGSLAEKNRTVDDAWVVGVKSVNADGLKIDAFFDENYRRRQPVTQLSDEKVAQAVEDAFLYDPRVKFFNPEISVENGTVTLTGTVDNLAAKQAAEDDARNTVGVFRVNNRLDVRPANPAEDTEITRKIKHLLTRNPFTDGSDITVWTNAGEVRLSGTVSTEFEKERAGQIAQIVPGVVSVDNQLKRTYTDGPVRVTPKPDEEIRTDINDHLWWSPYVDEATLHVDVDDGVARLNGTVTSYAELRSAMQQAYQGGAIGVVVDGVRVLEETAAPSPE